MKTTKSMPDRITLLDEARRGTPGAYGIYYQESEVRQSFPLHWHTFYELELVTGGKGAQWINGHAMPLEPGSFYLLSPTDLHRLSADTPLTFYSIKLPDDGLPAQLEKLLQQNDTPVTTQLQGERYAACRSDFLRLKSFLSTPSSYGEANVAALVTLLLTALYDAGLSGQRFIPDMAFRRQHTVLKYIHSHYLTPVTLDEIADAARLSPNHLCAQFTRVAGCGFVEYLTRLRFQHACTLLTETEMSVTEIAYASGFGSLSHFLRTFRNQKQTTPSAYRHAAQHR